MGYLNKEKQRAYCRDWVKKRRQTFFEGKCCVECGSLEPLELDHIDPTTKISNAIWSWREERRLAEISKCQILCKSCHRIKTNKELTKSWDHGTKTGYDYRGCRCSLCREAHKLNKREYRRKQRELVQLVRTLA